MNNLEFNKIFAALLVAGITVMLGGFIAELLMYPHELEKNAVEIDGGIIASTAVAGPVGPDPILHLIATADVVRGKKLSKACVACHSFDNGGPRKVGPNLYGMVGGPKAAKGGFEYSSAMREAGGAWSYEDLNEFLWKPKKAMPGTKMNYIGLKKPADRAAIIVWLRDQGSSSFPPPSASEVAAEAAQNVQPEAGDEIETLTAIEPSAGEIAPGAMQSEAAQEAAFVEPEAGADMPGDAPQASSDEVTVEGVEGMAEDVPKAIDDLGEFLDDVMPDAE